MAFHEMGKFSDPGILILTSLADGPKHGYAMIEDIYNICKIKLGAGTLYGAISRLEERGLIEPLSVEDRRKPYQLTALGTQVLKQHLESLSSFAKQGLWRLSTT